MGEHIRAFTLFTSYNPTTMQSCIVSTILGLCLMGLLASSEMQFSDALSEVHSLPAELFQEHGASMDMMAVATSKDVAKMANARSSQELQHVLDNMDEVQLKTVLGRV